jgi:hypothetical protein
MWYDYFPCWLVGHRYGYSQDGIQYCARCGIGRRLPCPHKWKLIRDDPYGSKEELSDGTVSKTISYHRMTLQCEKCGDIRIIRGDNHEND